MAEQPPPLSPVHARLVEAMARRAASQPAAVQRLLQARIAELAAAPRATEPGAAPAPDALEALVPGPLAALVVQLAEHPLAPVATTPADRPAAAAPLAPAPEPPGLDYFRSTWSRLQAEQRLAQSQARLPGNAGPLNSQHLVHRALLLMQALSPEYLQGFMEQVDALLWLDGVSDAAGPGRA
ncbi:MAG: DUF2894 domain-containing protein [Pseudomonadota bacterium]